MALIRRWTPEQQAEWDAWVAGRPPIVRAMAARVAPNRLYRLRTTGQRVFPVAYSENGTLRVYVSGGYNCVAFERHVFGIDPEDLTECDLPGPDEILGSLNLLGGEVDE